MSDSTHLWNWGAVWTMVHANLQAIDPTMLALLSITCLSLAMLTWAYERLKKPPARSLRLPRR